MACEQADILTSVYLADGSANELLSKFSTGIDKSSNIKDVVKRKAEIQNYEELSELAIMSSLVKSNPVYKQALIKRAKKFLRTADLAQIIDGLDNIPSLAKSIEDAGLSIKSLEGAMEDRIVRDYALAKNKGVSAILKGEFTDVPLGDVIKKYAKKSIEKIKEDLKIDDSYFNVLEDTDGGNRISEYVLNRELLGPADKDLIDSIPKLPIKNKITTKQLLSLIKKTTDEDMYNLVTFYGRNIAKEPELIKAVKARKLVTEYDQIVDYLKTAAKISKNVDQFNDSVGEYMKRFVKKGIETSDIYKETLKVYPNLEAKLLDIASRAKSISAAGKDINKVVKDFESFISEESDEAYELNTKFRSKAIAITSNGTQTAKDPVFYNSRERYKKASPENLAQSNLYEQYYRKGAIALGDIETIDTLDAVKTALKNKRAVMVQNVVEFNELKKSIDKADWDKIIFPKLGQDLGYFTDNDTLYIGGKNYAKDIIKQDLDLLGVQPQLFDSDFDKAWQDFIKVRVGDLNAKELQRLGRPEEFLENDKLVLSALGNRVTTFVDFGDEWKQFDELENEGVLSILEQTIRDNFDDETAARIIENLEVSDYGDAKRLLFSYKFAVTPESSWKALEQLVSNVAGEESISNNIGVVALNMLRKLTDAGYDFPGYSTLHSFVSAKMLGEETTASRAFIQDLIAKNPAEENSSFVNYNELLIEDVNRIFDDSKIGTSTYDFKETPIEGAGKAFVAFDGDILASVRQDIAKRSKKTTPSSLANEIASDSEGIDVIIDKYTSKATTALSEGAGEGNQWKLKEEAATAIKEYEDYLTNKYGPLLDNERQFRTSKYSLIKLTDDADIPLLESEGEKIKAAIKDNLNKLQDSSDRRFASFKNGVFVGGVKDELKNMTLSSTDLRKTISKINIDGLTQADAAKLYDFVRANDYALSNVTNRYILAYDKVFPGMKDFFRDYEVVQTSYGELPYKLYSTNISGLGAIVDKEAKADIFTAVTKSIKAGTAIDPQILRGMVDDALDKNAIDPAFAQSYVDEFSPYYKLFQLPKEIMDTLPPQFILDPETRKVLDSITIDGADGVQNLSHYFDRTPDEALPQVLKGSNSFIKPDLEQGRTMLDDYAGNEKIIKDLAVQSAEADALFNQFSMTSAIGVIKKYTPQNSKLKRIPELVDNLIPKAKLATEAMNIMNQKNILDIQNSLVNFMAMGDGEFLDVLKVPLTDEELSAFALADYFRTLEEGAKGLTGTTFDANLAKAWEFLIEIKPKDLPSGLAKLKDGVLTFFGKGDIAASKVRAFQRSISGSRLFGLADWDLGKPILADYLDVTKGVPEVIGRSLRGRTTETPELLGNVNAILGVNLTKDDMLKLLAGLDYPKYENIFAFTRANRFFNAKSLRLILGGLQTVYGAGGIISQTPGYISKKLLLKKAVGATDDQIAQAFALMVDNGMLNVNIPGISDLKKAFGAAGEELYTKIRKKIDANFETGVGDITNQSTWNIIKEVLSAAGQSPNNLLDIFFADDLRSIHLYQAIKNRGFSSVEDLRYFLARMSEAEGKNLLDEINGTATRTYGMDIAMPVADLYKQGENIGSGPIGRVLSYGYQLVAFPFGWKAGWGNNSARNFVRTFGQTGNIGYYLAKNGFSEASKQEVIKWVINNPEFGDFMQQLIMSATSIVKVKRLVFDQDDWSASDQGDAQDIKDALQLLVMPVAGFQSSSFWRAFGGVITGEDKGAEFMNAWGRAFSQAKIIRATVAVLAADDKLEALQNETYKLGTAGVRYVLDDMELKDSNSVAFRNEVLGDNAIFIGTTASPTKKLVDYLNNVKMDEKIEKDGYVKTFFESVIKGGILGQNVTVGWDFVKGLFGGEKTNAILNMRGNKDKLFGILKDNKLLQAVNEKGLVDLEKLKSQPDAYNAYMDNIQQLVAFGSKPDDQFFNGITDFLEGKEIKDADLYVMFKTIADSDGSDYVASLKERFNQRLTSDQKLNVLVGIYSDLQKKEYNIPGLNNQMAQLKQKVQYDAEFAIIEKAWDDENKRIYGKRNATQLPKEVVQNLKNKYSEAYINDIVKYDRNKYQELLFEGVVKSGAEELKDYVKSYKDKGGNVQVELLPKWENLIKKDLDIKRQIAKGDVHDLGLRSNNIYTAVIDSPGTSDETKILMAKSIMDYTEQQGNLTDAEKFHIKSDLLISLKSLIGKESKIRSSFGDEFFTPFVESYYGTKLQGDALIDDINNTLDNGKEVGAGKLGKTKKPNAVLAKLLDNQKQLREVIKGNVDLFKGIKSIKPSANTFGFDINKKNPAPKPFESQGITSSISKPSLSEKVAKQNKDIKRIYSVKKPAGAPKKTKSA